MTSLNTDSHKYSQGTSNSDEVRKFDSLSDDWWHPKGSFSLLHHMNPSRLSFIKDHTASYITKTSDSLTPLTGLRLLDVGCGGGLLSEPLARMGAHVTGLDASSKAIAVAQAHSLENDLDIAYHHGTIETFNANPFDVICALEIIEHVDHPSLFIESCMKKLKPQGLFFLSTLNKTLQSYFEAIIVAEYLLKWAPKGTHDWQHFFEPHTLVDLVGTFGGKVLDIKGMAYHPFKRSWSLVSKPQTNYIMVFKKI